MCTSCLQGIIDADPKPGRWILTGSQNLALLESVSQSLAGRSAAVGLRPLLDKVHEQTRAALWKVSEHVAQRPINRQIVPLKGNQ